MSGPFLYALLSRYSKAAAWPPSNWPQPVPSAAIEIVDVDSLTTVNAFSIGSREPTALELVGGELYVVDSSHNEVVVLRGWGAYVSTLSVSPAPSDCVASPDGSRVYVAGSGAIDVIETNPLRVAQSVPVQSFAASGVTISEDGRTVVAVGERSGTGIALVLDTSALSVREVPLAGVHAALDAAFIEPDLALVWTGSSFLQVNTSSATQLSAATVPTSGQGFGQTFGISTLQFSSPARRAFAIDYTETNFGEFTVPLGQIESLDPSTGKASTVAQLFVPPYLMRLGPSGDKLFLVRGHEMGSSTDELSVFDVAAGALSPRKYWFSQADLFVTDLRVQWPTYTLQWPWPLPWPKAFGPFPRPVPKGPLRGSGEGIWSFVDPLWDPLYGVAVHVSLGLGGPLGRGIARVIDNWRRRFSTPEQPARPPRD